MPDSTSLRGTIAEAHAFVLHHPDTKWIELFVIDVNGVPRGKLLHRDELMAVYESGRMLPSTLFGLTLWGDNVDSSGLVWEIGDADVAAYPLPGALWQMPASIRVPTTSNREGQGRPGSTDGTLNYAALQVTLDREGAPGTCHADPRHQLVEIIARLQRRNVYPVMAAELEFYLLDPVADTCGAPLPAPYPNGRRPADSEVYGIRELHQIEPFLVSLYAACEAQEVPARATISEGAPGQVEIALAHGDALTAIDQAIRYKRLVKVIAQQHGMEATFMAKPFAKQAGSGLHMHVSLVDSDGCNVFADPDPAGSVLLRHAVAGLLETLGDAFLLCCPNANSYARVKPMSFVPTAATWGVNNRTVAVRIPAGPAATRHIEHRVAGADANPYLVAAAVLAGMLSGLEKGALPGAPVEGNAQTALLHGATLPCDWGTALTRWHRSHWARATFGDAFVDFYHAIKSAERQSYRDEVSEKDWRRYLVQT